MALKAGKLRHRVSLEEMSETIDSYGQREPYWSHVADLWAAIEPLSAKEFIAAQQLQSQVTTRITIRYRSGVTAGMRIVHRGTIYNIAGVLADKDSGIEYLTLPCSSGVNDG
jgi:SPP1 family predicted phage head-tail adaptor